MGARDLARRGSGADLWVDRGSGAGAASRVGNSRTCCGKTVVALHGTAAAKLIFAMMDALKTWWWFRRLPVLLGILGEDALDGNGVPHAVSRLPALTQSERDALARLLTKVHPSHLVRAVSRLR